jgi:DNA-binding response OmpR family regulator
MKLLLIEDSEKLRSTLKAGFRKLGYTVDDTGDGKEGYDYAMLYDYDVAILDLMLPTLSGLEILKKLRDNRRNINILILSAKDKIEDRINGLNLGADDYLIKPFSFDELDARLKTLVRRKYDHQSPIIELGKITVDTLMMEVRVKNNSLPLTPKEYQIMEYLSLNSGRIICYENLINQVYASTENVSLNTLEAHVSAIRKKIKHVETENILKTKRGIGYYIDSQ